MAHIEVNSFLKKMIGSIEPFYQQARVLEIGSYDVNGSVRSTFNDVKEYVGVDLIPGPSVDVVSKGHLYYSDTKFDIVLSVESFEHNSYWIETVINMFDLADENGVVIFTCATRGRLEHGTYRTDPFSSPGTSSSQNSYYLNLTADDFKKIPYFDKMFIAHDFYVNNLTKDLYFYGLKGNAKITPKKAALFFKNSTDAANHVRRKTKLTSYLKVRLIYFFLSPFYSILSEKHYQNSTFFAYKIIRRLFKSLNV